MSRPITITEAAHRNHEELFPNHKSTLKVAEPELIEIFGNFAPTQFEYWIQRRSTTGV